MLGRNYNPRTLVLIECVVSYPMAVIILSMADFSCIENSVERTQELYGLFFDTFQCKSMACTNHKLSGKVYKCSEIRCNELFSLQLKSDFLAW